MREKALALSSRGCYWESGCSERLFDVCLGWIRYWHPSRPVGSFEEVSRSIPEDLMIHRVESGRDWLAAAHVCFPSQWLPEEKIGRTWEQIHRPVPMDLSSSSRIVRAMVHAGPFERFVWSVVYDDRYDFHPSLKASSFDPASPLVLVKVERQVTVPFPQAGCCLFILRQYLVRDYDRELLARAIEGMDEKQRAYKGLLDPTSLLVYLRS